MNTMMTDLDRAFDFFKKNQSKLLKQYLGRYIIIVGEEVKADFGSQVEAYEYGMSNLEPGTFIIQHVVPGKEAYTRKYHTSRLSF